MKKSFRLAVMLVAVLCCFSCMDHLKKMIRFDTNDQSKESLDKARVCVENNQNDKITLSANAVAYYNRLENIAGIIGKYTIRNTQNYKGNNALHRSAFIGNIEAVKRLINEGYDLKAKDQFGYIPFDLASSKEVKELLNPNS